VEDEENERSGLAELVSAWGYRTDTAKDGLEGLEKVATWSPGIVVTDFKMRAWMAWSCCSVFQINRSRSP